MRRLDLNLLVATDALLSERSITRAGERIFLSQSAMSGALELHNLESLPGDGFTVCCFPAKIRGASAGWTRGGDLQFMNCSRLSSLVKETI